MISVARAVRKIERRNACSGVDVDSLKDYLDFDLRTLAGTSMIGKSQRETEIPFDSAG